MFIVVGPCCNSSFCSCLPSLLGFVAATAAADHDLLVPPAELPKKRGGRRRRREEGRSIKVEGNMGINCTRPLSHHIIPYLSSSYPH
jgi:hypothetical protein